MQDLFLSIYFGSAWPGWQTNLRLAERILQDYGLCSFNGVRQIQIQSLSEWPIRGSIMCSCWLSGAVLSLFRACCSFAPFVAICGFSGGGSSQQAGTRKGPPLLPCCHWPASTACLVCRKGSVFNVRANYSFSSLFRRSCDEPCLMLGCSSACASFPSSPGCLEANAGPRNHVHIFRPETVRDVFEYRNAPPGADPMPSPKV